VRRKKGLHFGGRGRQADAGAGRGGAGDGKEEERAQQGTTGEDGGNGLESMSAGPGADKRTRGLSGPMHFGPKSETGMGAHGRLRTTLSVWVAPVGHVFYPRGLVRTQGGCLHRPTGDALSREASKPATKSAQTKLVVSSCPALQPHSTLPSCSIHPHGRSPPIT
jgi:hypothetical protein